MIRLSSHAGLASLFLPLSVSPLFLSVRFSEKWVMRGHAIRHGAQQKATEQSAFTSKVIKVPKL